MGYVTICSVLVCVRTSYHRHSGTVLTVVSIITHAQHKAGTHTHMHTHCETNYRLTKPLVTVTAQLLTVVLLYIQVCLHVTLCCCASSSQHYEGTTIL